MDDVLISLSCVLFEWSGQAGNSPWAPGQKYPKTLCLEGIHVKFSHGIAHVWDLWAANKQHNTWQSPPRPGSLFWGWKQPKCTWMLPKGLEFSCFQMWLGPESAGWPWLIKDTALHPFPSWGPTGVMLATLIQHFAVPWGQAQSQDWRLLCRAAVTTESQAKAYWCLGLQWIDFGQFWIRCSKL